MIEHELLVEQGILVIRPTKRLEEDDFAVLAKSIDPYIEQHGKLRGLMIQAERFPGWQGVEGLTSHIRFVKNHHNDIERVAVITDNPILAVLPRLANTMVHAEVKHFGISEQKTALRWLAGSSI